MSVCTLRRAWRRGLNGSAPSKTQWQSEEAVDPLAQLDLDLDALLNEIGRNRKS